jgi:hypothetical protein
MHPKLDGKAESERILGDKCSNWDIIGLLPNFVVEWSILLRILEVYGSHPGSETGYPE